MTLNPERKSDQKLLPLRKAAMDKERYDIYPTFKINGNVFISGYEELANEISNDSIIVADGYGGVLFDQFRSGLDQQLQKLNLKTVWHNTDKYLKCEEEINLIISPFTGNDDPLFGYKAGISLSDFFNTDALMSLVPDPRADINILYGTGATLACWPGRLIYIDLPKNEIQYRARAGSVTNLGSKTATSGKQTYKRFYFVDWVVLNKHKSNILSGIDFLIDGQNPNNPVCIPGVDLRATLKTLSSNFFRVRPWFESSVWGGDWMKKNIPGLNEDAVNYGWSFELITPENGLLLENRGYLLEITFDTLMFQEHDSVQGKHSEIYGTEFPIRFDFLDTFNGGNLSVQCHPQRDYISMEFGEKITQEETYYILDAMEGAKCYLGFQESIDPKTFEDALTESFETRKSLDITKYVQVHDSKKHDLFLIPPGTIHGSGKDNLVLEISSTPYIFTFKLYDWVRTDLDGSFRPLNIKRGMDNLNFERNGKYVQEKLISRPVLLNEGPDWKLYELPTHEDHSYNIRRYVFRSEITINTENVCHVLSLVEGSNAEIISENGLSQNMKYAETFVVPAAAKSYRILNKGINEAMIVIAFSK